MSLKTALQSLFKKEKQDNSSFPIAYKLNGEMPVYSLFGDDIYSRDQIQIAISIKAEEMSKLEPRHIKLRNGGDYDTIHDNISNILLNPNDLMTLSDFLERITWEYEMNYNSFIIPIWSDEKRTSLVALYPISPDETIFLEEEKTGDLFVNFRIGTNQIMTPYRNIIHWRKRYSVDEYQGGGKDGQPDNRAVLELLKINESLIESVAKGVNSSLAVNGVLKFGTLMSKNQMADSLAEFQQALQLNKSGIVPLDMGGDYIPISKDPKIVDEATLKFLDERIARATGVPLPILKGDFTKAQHEAFFQKTLEPMIRSMGQAFTKGLFTNRSMQFGNRINFYYDELFNMTIENKLETIRLLGDSGALYENQKLRILGMAPDPALDGVRTMSLNYTRDVKKVADEDVSSEGEEDTGASQEQR